jgi:hypothetical protein
MQKLKGTHEQKLKDPKNSSESGSWESQECE